jgi:transposase
MEKKFIRMGISLPRATMCGWAMKIADSCEIILDLLKKEVRSGPLINADETPLKVLNKSNKSKCYMWVYRGGTSDHPSVIYEYHPDRSGDAAAAFLKAYKGYVQTDGYSGYDFLDHDKNITHVGCWTHARRKFIDVTKAAGDAGVKKKGKAHEALKYIRKLYKIEKKAKKHKLKPDELVQERLNKAVPILNEFKEWLIHTYEETPPKGLLGKAISYTLNQWDRLINYIHNGHVTPDNNAAENAIRPFVVGRKNWLFSGTSEGAKASAAMYSLIETAKANKIEPYWYLRYLFKNLPNAMTTEEFKALLPMYVDKSKLNNPVYK